MNEEMIKQIKEDFDAVITYSQEIPNPKTDKLFELWKNNKYWYYKVFGDKLIYEWPAKLTFNLDDETKQQKVIDFANQVSGNWGNDLLAQFISNQKDGFFDNITVEDFRVGDQIIKKGTKLVKAFKYFTNSERCLFDLQSRASQIIQEDKIEGRLCLSIHPLDFLSLSENTYNWRSCHALDGEYRAGNLSYMMDKNTFICYLKADDETKLPNFPNYVPWNSKKWRVLLFLSDDKRLLIAGRQYPFGTSTGMEHVLKALLPEVGLLTADKNFGWTDWNNFIIEEQKMTNGITIQFNDKYFPLGYELVSLDNTFKDAPGSKHYNDVLHSSCYKPIYSFMYNRSWWGEGGYPTTCKGTTTFTIGAYTYCLRCGEEECLSAADTMMCEDCELKYGTSENDMFIYCDCCDSRFYADDAYYVGDERICPHCFREYVVRCECCGEPMWRENMIYDEENEQYLCRYCFNDRYE